MGLVAGRVGRPHGLDGSFHVTRPEASLLDAAATVTVTGAERRVVRKAGTPARPIMRLEGVDDRSAAEALRGEELQVDESMAPPLEEGEYRLEQLEGCTVVDGERVVGVVDRVTVLPSCEMLEVGDLLIPLVADAVRSIDVDARRIEIDLEFLG